MAYRRAQQLAKNGAVQSALSKREGREVSADEIEGRIVAEILRNSDQSAAEQSGGIHDYGLRAVIGCQNLNCDGYKNDPNYSDASYNVQYIAPNSNSYAKGISFDGTGQTYNQLVKQNVKDNPVSTGIAGVALVGTGVAVAGPAALVPRAIAGGTGVAASAGFQLLGSQPMDWWDLGIAGVTGFVTGGASSWAQGVTAATAINTGGALAGSAIKGENPNGAMAGAAVGSVAGYAVGKIVEKPLSSVYNPWWLPNWIPVGLFGMVKPNVPSVVPGAVGGVGSSLVQESVGSGTKDGVNKYQGP